MLPTEQSVSIYIYLLVLRHLINALIFVFVLLFHYHKNRLIRHRATVYTTRKRPVLSFNQQPVGKWCLVAARAAKGTVSGIYSMLIHIFDECLIVVLITPASARNHLIFSVNGVPLFSVFSHYIKSAWDVCSKGVFVFGYRWVLGWQTWPRTWSPTIHHLAVLQAVLCLSFSWSPRHRLCLSLFFFPQI